MSSPIKIRVSNAAETQLALEKQQRVNDLYQYLIAFEPGSSVLPHLSLSLFNHEVLFTSTSVAGVRHSMLRNTERLQNILFQNATLLVERDIDIFLFS